MGKSRLLILLPAIAATAVAAYLIYIYFQSKSGHEAPPVSGTYAAHYYQRPEISLKTIRLKVFYAVPANRAQSLDLKWRERLELVLEEARKFHELQFQGLSKLDYEVFPEPFMLERENQHYDTENTDRGNPEALKRVTAEIERREPSFLKAPSGEFMAIAIVYEGVGASGAEGAMIISRNFLANQEYEPVAAALLYHELGHTYGLPDRYDLETGEPFSHDIMGSGRRKPLLTNYLDESLLRDLGVISQ